MNKKEQLPLTLDAHIHIIPDVDDGATNLQDALAMIGRSVEAGITDMIASSHSFAYDSEEEAARSKEQFRKLQAAAAEAYPEIHLYLGCEVFCLARYMTHILDYLDRGIYPSMNGTRYVMIEFPDWNLAEDEVLYCVDRLQEAGWIPIFAHIERYARSFSNIDFVRRMRARGCLFQLNLYDLIEEPIDDIRLLAQELIRQNLIDFIGSDAHNMHHRPPCYQSGLLYLKEHAFCESLNLAYDLLLHP